MFANSFYQYYKNNSNFTQSNSNIFLINDDFYCENLTDFSNAQKHFINTVVYDNHCIGASYGSKIPTEHHNFTKAEQSFESIFDYLNINFPRLRINQAKTKKQLKYNQCSFINHIIIDVDKKPNDISQDRFNEILMNFVITFEPNFIICSKEKINSIQFIFTLERPTFKNQVIKLKNGKHIYNPQYILRTILNSFCFADFGNQNLNGKNPFYRDWNTVHFNREPHLIEDLLLKAITVLENKEKSLDSEILDILDKSELSLAEIKKDKTEWLNLNQAYFIAIKKGKNKNYIYDEESRDCQIFDFLRTFAYSQTRLYFKTHSTDEIDFKFYLANYLESIKIPDEILCTTKNKALAKSQILKIIRSIVNFCYENKINFINGTYSNQFKHVNEQKQRRKEENKNLILNYFEHSIPQRIIKADVNYLTSVLKITDRTLGKYLIELRKTFYVKQKQNNNIRKRLENDYKVFQKYSKLEETGLKITEIAKIMKMKEQHLKLIIENLTNEY